MQIVYAVLALLGAACCFVAWRSERQTTLAHPLLWFAAAWATWGVAYVVVDPDVRGVAPWRYLALCLTGCAGVAVLGARRPIVGPWNFVVLGLLAVLLLPLAEGFFLRALTLGGVRLGFLGATLALGILNYVPTRFGPAALLLGLGVAGEFALLCELSLPPWLAPTAHLSVLSAPMLALLLGKLPRHVAAFDRLWLDFRDRYGLVWSQRLREQFNRAADNAHLGVTLSWRGLHTAASTSEESRTRATETLRALLKRFGPDSPEVASLTERSTSGM